jgi:YVTN family beta-propeller protein
MKSRLLRWLAAASLIGACLGLLRSQTMDLDKDGSRRSAHAVPEDGLYKSPIGLLVSRDGKVLYVACERSNEVLAVDTVTNRIAGRAATGRHPLGLALSPDGSLLYVGNRWDHTISSIDTARMETLATFKSGEDPHGMTTDTTGDFLYVANLATDDVSVFDTRSRIEVKRLQAGHSPFDVELSPDGRFVYVSHVLSNPVPFRTAPVTELTVIDTRRQIVAGRRDLVSTVIAQGVAVSPDNGLVAVALEMPKNLIPETQVYQGWMVTHGIALAETGPRGRVAYLLLDEPNLYYADAYGLAFSPDGKRLYVSSSGVDVVSVLDMEKVSALLEMDEGRIGIRDEKLRTYARNLALSSEYVVARIPTQQNPKNVAITPDGRRLYVANRLSDSVLVIDTARNAAGAVIDLGGPKIETVLRRGERNFNYSSISFQKQLSCNTCHPENHLDGLVYDIVAPEEGIGRSLVDNRTMRGIVGTGPYKWSGKNPTIARQDGPRAAQLFFRSHGFEPDELQATVKFIESIGLQKSRYAPVDGRLNEFQRRGRTYFERAYTRDGRYIPVANRCITCHPSPLYTDGQVHDIGSGAPTDDITEFDTPQIGNTYETAPFLHDGRSNTLEEIWTVFNPNDTHGLTNDMAKENLNDLIEFVKTLWVGEPVPDGKLFDLLFEKSRAGTYRLPVRDREPVAAPAAKYVGNEVCGTCHTREYKRWLGTRHARTWVMLGMAESAAPIKARLKVEGDPQTSGTCLGCHGTAASAPAPFRADTFHIEEGVQCERCHGPGGRYATEEVMKDRQRSVAAGLVLPDRTLCFSCHEAKESHESLHRKPFDFEPAYAKIKHLH